MYGAKITHHISFATYSFYVDCGAGLREGGVIR